MTDPVALGAFDLGPELARGGMAVVHHGTHRATGTAVAIKVVTGAAAAHQGALEREIRRIAQLDHPAIIRVHDHGRLPAAVASLGLDPERPWLAMDFLSGGSLETAPPRDWHDVRSIAAQVLAGLAHAHARGLVHRDLKPGNILRSERGRAVLTDFGIATARSERAEGSVTGTPWVMAPEQVRGEADAIGPWTDLYALGCTVWWLVAGRPPFAGTDVLQVLRSHLLDDLPDLQPTFPVPDGLGEWLGWLLKRDPMARYQRAADALAALEGLGDPARGAPGAVWVSLDRGATGSAETWSADLLPEHEGVAVDDGVPARAPVCPRTLPTPPRPGARGFVDAGLGLAGFRRPPLVGRDAGWTALVEALDAVVDSGRARCVVLQGPPGVGLTWLGRCFVEAAEEAGAAIGVVAGPGQGTVVSSELAAALGCAGAGGVDAERLERWMISRDPDFDPARIADLGSGVPAAARRAALWSLIDVASMERPVVLLLDDLDEDAEMRALVRHGLGRPGRVLMIGTSRRDLPVASGVTVQPVPILPRAETRRLLDTLVDLSPMALEQLSDLVEGRPAVAVSLVAELAARGQLVATDSGAGLNGPLEIPEHLSDVVLRTLDEVVVGPGEERAIYVAVALGANVEPERWSLLADYPLADCLDLADRLVTADLWTPNATGFRFRDGLLREAVRSRAIERGGWVDLCSACAAHLVGSTDARDRIRRARLLVDAGRSSEALEPLQQGLAWLTGQEDYLEAERTAVFFLELVERMQLDPRRADLQLGMSSVVAAYHHLGWNELLGDIGRRWLELPGVAEGETVLAVHAYKAVCEAARARGDQAAATEAAERSYRAYLKLGGSHRGMPEFTLARCLGNDPSRYDEALELYQVCIESLNSSWQAAAWYYRYLICDSRGQYDLAIAAIEAGCAALDEAAPPTTRALVTAGRAQAYADMGDIDRGIAGWRDALPVLERFGYLSGPFARLNLAALYLKAGEIDAGEREATHALREFARIGRRTGELCVRSVLVHAAALRGDRIRMEEQLDALRAMLADVDLAEPALCTELEAAADAVVAEHPELAREMLELARDHWQFLERPDEVSRLAERIAAVR